MDRSSVGARFRDVYKLLDGRRFYGQILDIPDTTRVSNFHSARRLLRTSLESPLTPGTIFISPNGERFLAAEHGISYGYHHFKLFQMDLTLQWKRDNKVTDAVTGLTKGSVVKTSLGQIEGTYEDKSSVEDQLLVPKARNTLITNAALQLGDYADDRVVFEVINQLGVTIAGVR